MDQSAPPPSASAALAQLTPAVEWPMTLCVLLYGDHPELAERFFSRLVRHTPLELIRVRIGMNAVSGTTRSIVLQYSKRFSETIVIDSPKNLFKMPMMRRLFHEEPIETKWTIWFDDDSFARRDDWMQSLALTIEGAPDSAMLGTMASVWPDEKVLQFTETASWYRGLPYQMQKNDRGESEPIFQFVTGGFWAIRTDCLVALDWPDPRLRHYVDDFILGEALRQNGMPMLFHSSGIEVSGAQRRGPLDGRTGLE